MPGLLRQVARGLASPFMRAGAAYNEAAKRNPLGVGIVTTVLKTSAADIFAQKVIERRDEIDWKRNGVFSIFGFAYLGCWQYYLYNNVFVRITPSIQAYVGARGVGPVLTFLDQCVHHPLMYFPAFYLLRGAINGEAAEESLGKYKADAWENIKALWMVWVPAQLVNFSVVPLHLRVPFVAGVSFAWCIILSVLRGALGPAKQRVVEEWHHLEEAAGGKLQAGVQAASGALHGWEDQIAATSHAATSRLHELSSQLHVRVHPFERSAHHAHERMHAWSERMHLGEPMQYADRMHLAERMHLVDQTVPVVLADDGRQASRPANVPPTMSVTSLMSEVTPTAITTPNVVMKDDSMQLATTSSSNSAVAAATSTSTTPSTVSSLQWTGSSSGNEAAEAGSKSAAEMQPTEGVVVVAARHPAAQGKEQNHDVQVAGTRACGDHEAERVHVPASPMIAAACS